MVRSVQSLGETSLKRLHENDDEIIREVKRVREDLSKIAYTPPSGTTEELSSKERRQKVFESLQFNQINARQASIQNAHGKTCKWLLETPEYRNWLDLDKLGEHRGFFWIKGKPGAGKSTLMNFILCNAKTTMNGTTIVSFFFNARGGDLEKSTTGMFRSLLFQLLKRHPELRNILGYLDLESVDDEHFQWSLEPFKTLFQQAVQGLGRSPLICFIDALDECKDHDIRNMLIFFEHMGDLTSQLGIQFRVCFSSRHYPHITIKRGLHLFLEGQEGHEQDIVKYVDSELKIEYSKYSNEIQTELQKKARGVFMWVVLVVAILNKEHDDGNIHELQQRLHDIPGDLHELFRDILTRDRDNRGRLLLCIQWVLFSGYPLKPEELYFGLFSSIDPKILLQWDPDEITPIIIKRFILSSSKGLVEVTRSKFPTVQFIHESVKDFLLKSNGLQEIWPVLGGNIRGKSHELLKQCCLIQLRTDVKTTLNIAEPLLTDPLPQEAERFRHSAHEKFPFLGYAVQNVLYHANWAEAGGISQASFLSSFQPTEWAGLRNLFVERGVLPYIPPVSLLYILAECNLVALIKAYLSDKQSCFDVESSRYGSPIFAGFATQSRQTVAALLEAEAESQPGAPLFRSLSNQYYSKEEGNRITLDREFEFSQERGALSYTIEHGDETMLALMLCTGKFDINGVNEDGWTPLLWAADSGHEVIVKQLLENGAAIDFESPHGHTPVSLAVKKGHSAIVKLLISRGATFQTKDNKGRTPLLYAALNGDESLVKLLLEKGAAVEVADDDGWTPLHYAAWTGGEVITEMLLDGGAPLEGRQIHGQTPLFCAVERGQEGVVRLLLARDAIAEVENNFGETPLGLATERGPASIVELLQQNGMDIDGDES